MKLSKPTMLMLRRAAIMLVQALDAALLELYGWTPRGSSEQLTKRVE
jgi:hypothetical protein